VRRGNRFPQRCRLSEELCCAVWMLLPQRDLCQGVEAARHTPWVTNTPVARETGVEEASRAGVVALQEREFAQIAQDVREQRAIADLTGQPQALFEMRAGCNHIALFQGDTTDQLQCNGDRPRCPEGPPNL
jgi:hypothetical protein